MRFERHLGFVRALVLLALLGCGSKKSGSDKSAMQEPDASTPAMQDAGRPHDTVVEVPHGMVNGVEQSDGGMPMSSGFGIEPPHGPRSTAKIRVLVVEVTDHYALRGAEVSAGGKAIQTGETGFALIDEVYGKDSADVLVRAPEHTEGRARVPIRAGETSFVVIVVDSVQLVKVEDLAKGGKVEGTEQVPDSSVDAGYVIKTVLTLDLPEQALVAPWGAAASAGGTLSYVLLDAPEQAAVAPNGTSARAEDGSAVQLQVRTLFEVRVAQGGTPFTLMKPAGVDVSVPASAVVPSGGGAADDGDRLYWFDPHAGAFVARDPITEKSGVAHGEIDRFGLWAIGRPATGFGCVHGQVQDGAGAALPLAALRTTQLKGLGSQVTWADAAGNYCVAAPGGSIFSMYGLASSASSGLLRIDATGGPTSVPADASAPLCGDASTCADMGVLAAEPFGFRCVQGKLEPFMSQVSWSALSTDVPGGSGALDAGEPFCIEVPVGTELHIESAYGDCGDVHAITSGASSLCGESDDCIDLGTIKCCDAQETCSDAEDNDCDDMVDEGCMCGTTTCSPVGDICCTSQDTCGLHAPQTKKCLAPDITGLANGMCPTEMVDGVPLTGCCRSDMRCGIMDVQFGFGCVAREDALDVFLLDAALATLSCTQ